MISTYLKNKLQNDLFCGVDYVPPSVYYIALSKSSPSEDGSGVVEPVGGGYTRLAFNRGVVDFTMSIDGIVKNKIRKEFNESTSVWGRCTHYAIYDAATGGNMLYFNALTHARDVDIEMQLFVNPEDLTFSLS